MDDYSLVPVDHQPDFENCSLVPVDHDPFSDRGGIQPALSPQAPTQPTQPIRPVRPQPPATGVGQPDVGAPANNTLTSEVGDSWNPGTDNSDISGPIPSTASASPQDKPAYDWSRFNQPFGELKPATFTPTQQIGHSAADALTALGMQPYTANDLAKRIGNVLGLTPLGVAGSALDLIDAKRRGDFPGAVAAAAGMIPGAKGVARGVAVQFGQRSISPTFRNGTFAGQSVSDVAAGLKSGTISVDQLPLRTITRDGVTYTINNRSLMALRQAGKELTILEDVTGNPFFEGPLTVRVAEIGAKKGPNFVPIIRKR